MTSFTKVGFYAFEYHRMHGFFRAMITLQISYITLHFRTARASPAPRTFRNGGISLARLFAIRRVYATVHRVGYNYVAIVQPHPITTHWTLNLLLLLVHPFHHRLSMFLYAVHFLVSVRMFARSKAHLLQQQESSLICEAVLPLAGGKFAIFEVLAYRSSFHSKSRPYYSVYARAVGTARGASAGSRKRQSQLCFIRNVHFYTPNSVHNAPTTPTACRMCVIHLNRG